MSSRSLAAARARRAGEQAPPVSGNRPITSISSQPAFMQQNIPQTSNIRLARSQGQQQIPRTQNMNYYEKQGQNMKKNIKGNIQSNINSNSQNNLPFSKLSISDAIGLITLRLGRVEQWIIETEHDNSTKESDNINSNNIDNSVLNALINRIENLEKKENLNNLVGISPEIIKKLNEEPIELFIEKMDKCLEMKSEIEKLNLSELQNIINDLRLQNAIKDEHIFRLIRDIKSLNDTLKTFMLTYDNYVQETNGKFNDYETALSAIENEIYNPQLNDKNVLDNSINNNNEELMLNIEDNNNIKDLLKDDLANINI